ncbi:hypothetical protein B1F73_02245 [Pseudomonas syringae]|nr:hypothetical protein B1F73_02245 [Pseudomonas syringae]RXU27999.1 hypothetical protein B0A92_03900 [Pseudomonas syringae]
MRTCSRKGPCRRRKFSVQNNAFANKFAPTPCGQKPENSAFRAIQDLYSYEHRSSLAQHLRLLVEINAQRQPGK